MSAPNSTFQQILTYQHGMSGYAPSPSATSAQSRFQDRHSNVLADNRSFDSRQKNLAYQHSMPAFTPSQSAVMQSHYQDHPNVLAEHLSFNGGHETPASQYQHGILTFPPSQSAGTPMQSQYQDHQLDTLTEHLPFDSRHETLVYQRSMPDFAPSQSATMQSQYQDHHPKALVDSLSFDSGHETPAYQHTIPTFVPSQSTSTPTKSQYKDRQRNTLTEHPSFDSGHEVTPDGSVSYALSRPATLTPPQDQVDAQPNEPILPIPSMCPICRNQFKGVRERNRHLKSYLPHSIRCPSQGCPWTGRRPWDLKTHRVKKHSETGQVLGKEKYEIYDPKEFVKSILDGTSHVEVARSAFIKAKERLTELGEVDVGANVLGRKLDIKI